MADDIIKYLRLSQTRFNRNAEAADEIERLRVNQDMWKRTCAKLVGMMLPYSLLMTESEREELKIILSEASNG
jgi:hypothetical protein